MDQRPRRRRSAITLAAAAVLAAGACADASPSTPAEAEEALIEAMAWQGAPENSSGCGPVHDLVTSLGDLLPTTRFRVPGVGEHALAEAVVVGRFTDVEPDRGLVTPEPDGPGDLPVDFDDPDALYRTVHARFAVESVVAGEVDGDSVRVGFQVDGAGSDDRRFPGLDEVEAGLPALGRVVVFLDRSPFYDHDPAVLGLVDGLFLGRLDSGDRLDLPLIPREDAERLLAGTATLADLQRAAAGPVEVIDADLCLQPTG